MDQALGGVATHVDRTTDLIDLFVFLPLTLAVQVAQLRRERPTHSASRDVHFK